MEKWGFGDGNYVDLLENRRIEASIPSFNNRFQMHSSMIQRLALENELEGHQGCVNTITWNSTGSLLVSGSDDTQINIWSHANKKLIHTIDSGHSANIFCTKFVPETSDEVIVSAAGDAEVRIFNLSRGGSGIFEQDKPTTIFRCHSKRVKKLAVDALNPNIVWSASEDGTLRQHDFRQGTPCSSSSSSNCTCQNILLDLRHAHKKSLGDSSKYSLALKSCDINTTRPYQLLVGGSDSFARLYDRRMLSLSSFQVNRKPRCLGYFCPTHLSERVTDMQSSMHLTHVVFSPNGEELLLSYSGEHVYLMDANCDDHTIMKYTANDVSRQLNIPLIFNQSMTDLVSSNSIASRNFSKTFDRYHKLVKVASKALEDGSNYLYGIEACSEVLDGKDSDIDNALKYECLCVRAALFLKRNWKSDAHMTIRDCLKALNIEQSSYKAHYFMSEALIVIEKYEEALAYAMKAHQLNPSSIEAVDKVHSIKEQITAVEEQRGKNDDLARTLGDTFFLSEENDETYQNGPRSERENTDSDDATRLNLEAAYFDPERDQIVNQETGISKASSSSCQSDGPVRKPIDWAIDMKQRYIGHCNIGTDIKQASFLGQQGRFVASGSDDGRWFIWEKKTGRLIKVLSGDDAVVNCVQCHPSECVVATSGIDSTIKIWTPVAQTASILEEGSVGPETADVLNIMEENQQKLCHAHPTVLPFGLIEQFRLNELPEESLFECAQS
ncbi:hypothetical protein ZOSMA_3G01800 [Zostera marina]|uniref:WD and tetratricopeptide repeats protein 1 n=1 Tax=Zostera marina TaxID=29655 RepID=A0A0K9P3T5_ZOSMR|nr:hypothetical protein ZOSMA_3G01800 [Zostera marina]